jgi:hypothetical protein
MTRFTLFIYFTLNYTIAFSQNRLVSPNSEAEDRIIGMDISNFDSYRQNRQTPEFIGGLRKIENFDTSFNQFQFPFFAWNNPEFSGYRKTRFISKKFINILFGNNFLQNPNRFYVWKNGHYNDYFTINPIIDGAFGPAKFGFEQNLLNGRGVEILGQMGNDLAFYSRAMDYQALFPKYILDYSNFKRNNLPGIGMATINFLGYTDYFNAVGYMDAKIFERRDENDKIRYNIRATFGYDQQQIGIGYRSLILSDFAPPSLFLSVKYKLGPFEYQNLFKELIKDMSIDSSRTFNKKYLAIHRGTLKFEKIGLELGFSEMIVQTRPNNGFDLNYLNPIIFYRSVERDLGSPDNAMVAFDARFNRKKFSCYGQFVIDEFNTRDIFTNPNSAYNKFGSQIGLYYQIGRKYWNSGYMNFEYNQVRPYMYSHYSGNHYTNRLQSLAHPLESNFREFVYRLYLVPKSYPRWAIKLTSLLSWKGFDIGGGNYGGNILKNYATAIDVKNAPILQGALQRRFQLLTTISYYLQPNAKLELIYQFYKFTGFQAITNQNLSISFKLNFGGNRESVLF